MITEGMVKRGAKIRLLRDNVVIHDGNLGQLKRYKDDVKEDIQLLSNKYVEYDKLRYPAYSRALAIVTLAEEGVIDLPDKYYRVYSALAISCFICPASSSSP